jgi:hypothetical protein
MEFYACPKMHDLDIHCHMWWTFVVFSDLFGLKLHIGTPYRGKHFLTRQIPTSCLPKSGGIIGEH